MRNRACEPIGVRPTPSSPQPDDAKKDPNADSADQADCPLAGILAKPPRAAFENEILGLRQGGIPRGISFSTARCGFGSVRIQGAVRSTYTNPKHRVGAIRNSDAGH
jgi:hypothetical protein